MLPKIGVWIGTTIFSIGVLSCGVCATASAQFSMDVGVPSSVIGLHIPHFPNLMPVPRYPVYYARDLDSNLFFFEGHYWAYTQDNWYKSNWYNGPWDFVPPDTVPDSVLRVPLLYYRHPPPYFAGWDRQSPPHWGERWGSGWENRRRGWDHWDRNQAPRRAPAPRNSFYEPREDWERYRSDWLEDPQTPPPARKTPG
jgi:hypothetical protein